MSLMGQLTIPRPADVSNIRKLDLRDVPPRSVVTLRTESGATYWIVPDITARRAMETKIVGIHVGMQVHPLDMTYRSPTTIHGDRFIEIGEGWRFNGNSITGKVTSIMVGDVS